MYEKGTSHSSIMLLLVSVLFGKKSIYFELHLFRPHSLSPHYKYLLASLLWLIKLFRFIGLMLKEFYVFKSP